MTGILNDEDTYDIIHDTLETGIMKETKIQKASQILEVVTEDTIGVNILDRSIYLIDNGLSVESLLMCLSTKNKDNADSTNVTPITTV